MGKKLHRIKLVIVGDGECGKTCLLTVFRTNKFPEDQYIPTVFNTEVVDFEVDGRHIEMELWDTAGQDDYDRLRPLSYIDSDVVLTCFSLSSPNSLTNVVEKWAPEVRHYLPRAPIVLVGSKKDLQSDADVIARLSARNQTPVSTDQGQRVADQTRIRRYVECSARTGEGVREVFETAAKVVLQSRSSSAGICNVM